MAKPKKKVKKDNVISVDFEGVKAFKAIPEGSYVVEVSEVTQETSSTDNDMLKWTFEVTEGKFKGSKLWLNTSLVPAALFKLREVLEGLGLEVPDDVMELDLSDIVGLSCGVNVLHEDYQGKPQARIIDFISAEDVSEDEDDEKPKKKSKKDEDDEEEKPSKKSKKDEDDAPDVSSMDEDELQEVINEAGLDVDLEDYGSIKKKRAAVEEALESGGSSDDEEDEAEKFSEDTINEMDLDDLEKLNDDNDLGIKKIGKMKEKEARKLVLKALKKADLLED